MLVSSPWQRPQHHPRSLNRHRHEPKSPGKTRGHSHESHVSQGDTQGVRSLCHVTVPRPGPVLKLKRELLKWVVKQLHPKPLQTSPGRMRRDPEGSLGPAAHRVCGHRGGSPWLQHLQQTFWKSETIKKKPMFPKQIKDQHYRKAKHHEAQAGFPELLRGGHLSPDSGLGTEDAQDGDALAQSYSVGCPGVSLLQKNQEKPCLQRADT